MAISDYLFPESAINAIPSDKANDYLRHFAEIEQSVARPKLLVVLESPNYQSWLREPDVRTIPLWVEAFLRSNPKLVESSAKRRDYGPTLILEASEPEVALKDLVAAIQSMQ
jgi:hypothetical protein